MFPVILIKPGDITKQRVENLGIVKINGTELSNRIQATQLKSA